MGIGIPTFPGHDQAGTPTWFVSLTCDRRCGTNHEFAFPAACDGTTPPQHRIRRRARLYGWDFDGDTATCITCTTTGHHQSVARPATNTRSRPRPRPHIHQSPRHRTPTAV